MSFFPQDKHFRNFKMKIFSMCSIYMTFTNISYFCEMYFSHMSLGDVYEERMDNIRRKCTFLGRNLRALYLVLLGNIPVIYGLNFNSLYYIKNSFHLEQWKFFWVFFYFISFNALYLSTGDNARWKFLT